MNTNRLLPVNKSEIQIIKSMHVCYAYGPSRVCNELISIGAEKRKRVIDGKMNAVWTMPLDRWEDMKSWYDELPDVISEFATNSYRTALNEALSKLNMGELATIDYGENRIRGFQVVACNGDERTVREVEVVDGKPQRDKWLYIEYTVSKDKRYIDQRPISPYRK